MGGFPGQVEPSRSRRLEVRIQTYTLNKLGPGFRWSWLIDDLVPPYSLFTFVRRSIYSTVGTVISLALLTLFLN